MKIILVILFAFVLKFGVARYYSPFFKEVDEITPRLESQIHGVRKARTSDTNDDDDVVVDSQPQPIRSHHHHKYVDKDKGRIGQAPDIPSEQEIPADASLARSPVQVIPISQGQIAPQLAQSQVVPQLAQSQVVPQLAQSQVVPQVMPRVVPQVVQPGNAASPANANDPQPIYIQMPAPNAKTFAPRQNKDGASQPSSPNDEYYDDSSMDDDGQDVNCSDVKGTLMKIAAALHQVDNKLQRRPVSGSATQELASIRTYPTVGTVLLKNIVTSIISISTLADRIIKPPFTKTKKTKSEFKSTTKTTPSTTFQATPSEQTKIVSKNPQNNNPPGPAEPSKKTTAKPKDNLS